MIKNLHLSLSNYRMLFLLTISVILFNSDIARSQDMFGILASYPTSYVSKSEVTSAGHIYMTVWGSGVYRCTNAGAAWADIKWDNISTGITNFSLTDIEFIGASEVLVSTMGGGVYKTTSLTNINWQQTNSGLKNLNVKSLKVFPNGWILLGTYGGGIYISKNKGATWVESSKGLHYKDINCIEIADNGWILAATYGGGIYQSRDTAKTWKNSSSGLRNLFINDIRRNNIGFLYAATNGKGVYLSPNDGITWAPLDSFMLEPQKIVPVPLPDMNATCVTFNKNNTPVFGTRYGGIYADDNEKNFQWIPTRVRGQGVTSLSKNNTKMYCFLPYGFPRTSDNLGEEWESINGTSLLDLGQDFKIISHKQGEILAYRQKSIKRSTDDGKTWNLIVTFEDFINTVRVDSTGRFYATTGKGLYQASADLMTWNKIHFDGSIVHDIAFAPNGTKFATIQTIIEKVSDIREVWYTDKAGVWKKADMLFSDKQPAPKIVATNYNNDIYVCAAKNMYVSTNSGASWQLLPAFSHDIYAVDFFKDNTVIVATGGGGLHKSTSYNSFTKFTNYPAASIEVMAIGKNDEMYLTGKHALKDSLFAVYEASYKSLDKGEKFININGSFYGEPVLSFTVNKANDLYMATVSGMMYRSMDSANLSAPIVLNIPDNSKDVDINNSFLWTSTKRAELYQLEISYDEEFTYIWEGVTTSDTSHINENELFPNHKYYWRVRSKNHAAVSEWSPVRSFISKLAKPTLISPADKATGIPVFADLLWNSVEGATKYKIQISKDANFTNTEYEWISNDTLSKSQLLSGRTKYFWRVMAMNDISTSNWSLAWSFETVFGPPKLLLPADDTSGVAITPKMVWEKAVEVNEYDLQISDKNDFSNIIYEKLNIAGLEQISDLLDYDKVYYWRVRSRKADLFSEWSFVWKFRTAYSPVVLSSPQDNAVNELLKTQLQWMQHETQSKYEIQISKTSDFAVITEESNIDNNLSFICQKLESYQEYFWRARVISDENSGTWSKTNKFKTKPAQISLRTPDNLSQNNPVSISFLWYQTKGAKTYHLQIANDAEFNDLIFSQDTITNTSHIFAQLIPGSSYFWRVRAVSPEGVGDWSEVWKFTTGTNIPVLIAPENGKVNVIVPVKFEWAAITGALRYEIQVSETSNFLQYAARKDDVTELFFTSSELLYPKTYYWRVRAITNEGNSSWSQVWSFNTVDPLSVNDIIILSKSNIYPNPAESYILIDFNAIGDGDMTLKINDMSGKLVHVEQIQNNSDLFRVDCRGLNTGTYYLSIISKNKIYKGEFQIVK